MNETMAARIRALREMTVEQLRAKHREVFGEDTRSRNKDFLWKRIAWRLQAQEEGDIPERVRRRAAALANEADLRQRPPRDAFAGIDGPALEMTRTDAFGRVHDARLPMPGTVLTREYRGKHLHVTVLEAGFAYEGRTYRSLSAIAHEVTGGHWNGFLFFGLTKQRAAAGGAR
jgi:hypothetical protein